GKSDAPSRLEHAEYALQRLHGIKMVQDRVADDGIERRVAKIRKSFGVAEHQFDVRPVADRLLRDRLEVGGDVDGGDARPGQRQPAGEFSEAETELEDLQARPDAGLLDEQLRPPSDALLTGPGGMAPMFQRIGGQEFSMLDLVAMALACHTLR